MPSLYCQYQHSELLRGPHQVSYEKEYIDLVNSQSSIDVTRHHQHRSLTSRLVLAKMPLIRRPPQYDAAVEAVIPIPQGENGGTHQ